MSNPLTAFLTQAGGAFSGIAGPTQSFAQIAASAAASASSPIPGMSLAVFKMLYGPPNTGTASPIIALLPPLTATMASAIGPESQYCPGYPWAAEAVKALRTILPSTITIPDGDDSATPGAVPENTPAAELPGIYTPGLAASNGGFEVKVAGVEYMNLCIRFWVRPATGFPYVVGGLGAGFAGAYNIVLIVRSFLAQPNNYQNPLNDLLHNIATATPTLPLA